ncbi:MAG: thioredoxin family protein [Bacillota bacterium]
MLSEWQARSLSFLEYLAKADMNVPTMKDNYAAVFVSPEDDAFFSHLTASSPAGAVTCLALSESWCGDCVENLPVLAKLASLYPFMQLWIFPRDTNLDIMDRYLTDEKRIIPIFVFFDQDGKEIGRFIERPQGAHAFLHAARKNLERLPADEQKKGMYQARTDLRKLYRDGLAAETISMIRRILQNRYGPQNS